MCFRFYDINPCCSSRFISNAEWTASVYQFSCWGKLELYLLSTTNMTPVHVLVHVSWRESLWGISLGMELLPHSLCIDSTCRDCRAAVPFHSPVRGVRTSHCPLSFHHGAVHVLTFLTVWLVSDQLFKTETYAITPRCVEKVEGMRNPSFTLFALVLSQESGSMTWNDSVCFISTLYIFMLRNLMNISFKSFLRDTLSRIKVYDKRWYQNNPVFKTL